MWYLHDLRMKIKKKLMTDKDFIHLSEITTDSLAEYIHLNIYCGNKGWILHWVIAKCHLCYTEQILKWISTNEC